MRFKRKFICVLCSSLLFLFFVPVGANNDKSHDQQTSTAILNYLKSRPQTADSLQGITRWWQSRQTANASKGSVQRAMKLLETEGKVTRIQLSGGQVFYKVAR